MKKDFEDMTLKELRRDFEMPSNNFAVRQHMDGSILMFANNQSTRLKLSQINDLDILRMCKIEDPFSFDIYYNREQNK